jgi:hypothetical protein
LGINESLTGFLKNITFADLPDLNTITSVHIGSNSICQQDKTLLGNGKSNSVFVVIPVVVSRGHYNYWSNNYSGEFARTYQQMTSLRNIDIFLQDITGRKLELLGEVSLIFECTYQI